jgi:hypothetical protein
MKESRGGTGVNVYEGRGGKSGMAELLEENVKFDMVARTMMAVTVLHTKESEWLRSSSSSERKEKKEKLGKVRS